MVYVHKMFLNLSHFVHFSMIMLRRTEKYYYSEISASERHEYVFMQYINRNIFLFAST